jgi:hypothetical protein
MADNRFEFLRKLGVGFEKVIKVVEDLGPAYFTEDYPPFNLVKTDADTYVIQLSMVGYDKNDIQATHNDNVLTIRAKGSDAPEGAADDVYFHRGIKDGETYVKFPISPDLRFEGAVFEGHVLYVTYKTRKESDPPLKDGEVQVLDEIEAEEAKFLPHSGRVKFDSAGRARLRKQRMGFRKYAYDSKGRPIAVMDLEDETKVDEEETEKLLTGKTEKAAEIVKEVQKKAEEKKAEIEAKKAEVVAKVEEKKAEVAAKVEEKKAEVEEKKAEAAAKAEEAKAKAEDGKAKAEEKKAVAEVKKAEAELKKEEAKEKKVEAEVKKAEAEAKKADPKVDKVEEKAAEVEAAVAEKEAEKAEKKAEVAEKVAEVAEIKAEAEVKKAEAEEKIAEIEAEPKAEKKEVTVEVSAPETKPQVVEVAVDKKDEETLSVDIKDATIEVSDDAILEVIETPAGKADIVVAIKAEDAVKLAEADVDLKETVKEVVDTLDSAPALPEKTEKAEEKKVLLVDKEAEDKPTVEVTVPKEIPSVVAVTKDEAPTSPEVPAIKIEDTSEKIDPEAELVPVVTPAGNPDIVAAIEPAAKEEIEAAGGDIVEVVEKAVAKAVEEVKTSAPVDEKKVEEASDASLETEVVGEKAEEVKTELLNKEEANKPTVEVENKIEEPVKVVEVKISEDETVADAKVEVVDATVEVSEDAELTVVKTEEGKTDIVVAVTPEVKDELTKIGLEAEEVVEAAVEAPVSEPKEVEAKDETTVIVDKTDDSKPTVEVTVADETPQVVKAEVVEPEVATDAPVAVKLTDTAEDISETAELFPVVTPDGQPDMVVAVEPETKSTVDTGALVEAVEKAVNIADVTVDTPVADPVEVADASEVEEVVEKLDEIAKEPATIVVDKAEEDKPTVEVTLAAEESPQVVEVKIDENPSNKDVPAIVIEDATVEVKDDAVLSVAKTEEGKADIVVAMDAEEKKVLEEAGVNVEEVVAKAVETNDAAPVEPKVEEELSETVTVMVDKAAEDKPTVEVSTPDVLPQVVTAELKEEPVSGEVAIELKPAGTEISPEAELVAVVTPEDQPDMVVAVEPEVKEKLDAVSANTVEVIEKAVNIADVEVVATESTTVEEEVIAEAAAVEPVAEKLEEIAKEPATLVLNEKSEELPTVEVTLAAEDAPQIVEVKMDEAASNTEIPAIVVEDATLEVKSDTAELTVAPTEDGKSDVIVAVEPEVKAELEAAGVVVEEVVAEALEVNDAVPELPEETTVAPATEVEITVDSGATETVEVPEVVSQILTVEKEGDKLVVADTSDEVAPEAVIEAVVTPDGLPDVVVVADPVVEAELAKDDTTSKEVVEKAIEEAKPMVETVVDAPVEEIIDTTNVEFDTATSNVTSKPIVIVKKPGANT